ncbi:hypothetical protein [Amycolatopsis echigonensis]|uniref:DUF3558 domain-containing protein n=1 Tax=Amycolatopsis echigonensis TaxID=2576905 RepID=A0A2N3WQV6_9PSEU|nr:MULTISPECIES: hypothetical protein [Amycolatopsis]MBB2502798.1 hypothetical protein [Amycolatopsis echigonensis]PKV96248.1 hypothetical protein ATK30_7185 [Amycolatopsis niigatensis]
MLSRLALVLAVVAMAAGCGSGPAETFAKTNACELLATAARGTPIDPQRSEYKLTESTPAVTGGVGGCRTEWNPPRGKLTGDLAATLDLAEAEDWSGHSEPSSQGGHELRKDTTKGGGGCRYQVQISGTDAAVHIWYLDRSVGNEGSCPVAKRLVDQVLPSLP